MANRKSFAMVTISSPTMNFTSRPQIGMNCCGHLKWKSLTIYRDSVLQVNHWHQIPTNRLSSLPLPTIFSTPGAWQGPSGFDLVRADLAARGYETEAVTAAGCCASRHRGRKSWSTKGWCLKRNCIINSRPTSVGILNGQIMTPTYRYRLETSQ